MKKPLYLEVYERFVGDIRTGAIAPDSRLPSTRELSSLLKISRTTVETAYGALLSEGYIYSVPKVGYFAASLAKMPKIAGKPPKIAEEKPKKCGLLLSPDDVDLSLFPFSAWAKLSKEIMYNNPGLLRRGEGSGDIELKTEICSFLREMRGVVCTPAQIVIGAGMDYILQMLSRILPENSVYGLEDPGYRMTYELLSPNVPIPVDKSGLSTDALEKSGANIAYVTPSHQFPTGVCMPMKRRSELLRWAASKEGRYIIEDDYDSEFRYTTKTVPSMQGHDENGRVVYIATFSRTLAPSFRIAFAVLPPELLSSYRRVFGSASPTVSRFEQQTLAAFMKNGGYLRHLRRTCLSYGAKQKKLRELLSREQKITISGDEAGLHFLLSVKNKTEDELIFALLREGIAVSGASAYAKKASLNAVVIGFAGIAADELEAIAEKILRAVK